jgi:hypothetical protein
VPEEEKVDDDVQKGLEKFDKELDMFIAIKQKIEKNFCVSQESSKNEDRNFQLEILRVQLKYDTINLVMTVILSLLVSVLAVLFTLNQNSSEVFKPEVVSIVNTIIPILVVMTLGVIIAIALIASKGQNWDIEGIKKKFGLKKTEK